MSALGHDEREPIAERAEDGVSATVSEHEALPRPGQNERDARAPSRRHRHTDAESVPSLPLGPVIGRRSRSLPPVLRSVDPEMGDTTRGTMKSIATVSADPLSPRVPR